MLASLASTYRPAPSFLSGHPPAARRPNGEPSEYNLNLGRLIDSLGRDHPMLFEHPQDLSLFENTIELQGPNGELLRGAGQYTAVFDLLRFTRRVAMEDATLTHRISIEHREVRLRWSAKLHVKDLYFASLGSEPAIVHVDGISAYELDGRGHVHVHRLENIVISGRDRESLLDLPNLELMWRLPALVPPVAAPVPAGVGRFTRPIALGRAQAAAVHATRPAATRTAAPRMYAADETPAERAANLERRFAAAEAAAEAEADADPFVAPAEAGAAVVDFLKNPAGFTSKEETPVERAARERAEMASEAATLKALRAPAEAARASKGLPFFGLVRKPDTCESDSDCEQPQRCCDLLVARVCCSSGMMVGSVQPTRQGSLIPIPVDRDEPFPGNAPPSRQAPW